ncbi:hydroxymyristoyl-ACP dehydratase [Oleiagrimonas sp. C23AA]|uniref:hydroxymyristoyl-ACP dehydratase n=1 Tax=Oleiagrimonas sp. C23AA TaxID=2719047 RepID=UPI00142453E9|nr:hydroxymyristoyl-ACP dehydratase [Oleiagrimonas sp. C23AA]NII10876.1 hydroxymyristoyl-ACP dehydratase [Oleiagrimonas sp. C23AA]
MNEYTHDFTIAAEHPCLPGHFPGHPLVPGVLILDEVACALRSWRQKALTRVIDAKFIAPLLPAQSARVTLSAGRDPQRVRFAVHRGDTLLARGQLEHPA